MERLAVLEGTKNGENGIPPIESTRKRLLESRFTKTDWTTLIRVKKRQIEALSELRKRGLMSGRRESELRLSLISLYCRVQSLPRSLESAVISHRFSQIPGSL